MDLQLSEQLIISFMAIVTRLSTFWLASGVFASRDVPKVVMIVFIVICGVLFTPLMQAQIQIDTVNYFNVLINEVIVGIALGLSVHMAFMAVSIAGKLMDNQMGLNASNFTNQINNEQSIMSTWLLWLTLVAFFSMGGFGLMLGLLSQSYDSIPMNTTTASLLEQINIQYVISAFTKSIGYGLSLAFPVVAALYLMDCLLCLVSRAMPQINIYFISLPLKLLIGILIISFSLQHLVPLIEHFLQQAFWG